MPQTSTRVGNFTESVIREMTRVALRYDAINLSQGFPDDDPPLEVIQAAHQALEGPYHQYAITWGTPALREALAQKQKHFMGLDLDPDRNIVITCGGTEAMMVAMMTACNPGDTVIVFSPFYENYGADSILTGAKPIYVPLRPPDFQFDRAELRAAFEKGAKALVLCNPSNPSGKVFSKEELTYIGELAEEFDAFILTDEVYDHIVYEPYEHVYMASLPGMMERTISCGSFSKTYYMTGWRLGYVIANEKIADGAKKVHDFLTVGAAHPLQAAAATACKLPLSYYGKLTADYTRKRALTLEALDKVGLPYTTPQGAYYVLVDCSSLGIEDDVHFCDWMAKKIKVAAVPGSSFFAEPVNHLIRLQFAKHDEILIEAGQRLSRLTEVSYPGKG